MEQNYIEIENAVIRFPNFSGRPDKWNPNGGRRSFVLLLTDELAEDLTNSGCNVKVFQPRDDEEVPQPYISVKLNYNGPFPPNIYMICGRSKTLLNEDTVGNLDYSDIEHIDLILRPYDYGEKMGKGPDEPHVALYVKTMYVTIAQDNFASKYDFEDEEIPFE